MPRTDVSRLTQACNNIVQCVYNIVCTLHVCWQLLATSHWNCHVTTYFTGWPTLTERTRKIVCICMQVRLFVCMYACMIPWLSTCSLYRHSKLCEGHGPWINSKWSSPNKRLAVQYQCTTRAIDVISEEQLLNMPLSTGTPCKAGPELREYFTYLSIQWGRGLLMLLDPYQLKEGLAGTMPQLPSGHVYPWVSDRR